MSKIIKITSENIAEIRQAFEEALKGVKLSDGKISFTKTFGNIQRKANLYFTELAYLKMLTLVREFDKEVAWHGIAKRCEDEEDAYIIKRGIQQHPYAGTFSCEYVNNAIIC